MPPKPKHTPDQVIALRRTGMTYARIGEILGITQQYASYLGRMYKPKGYYSKPKAASEGMRTCLKCGEDFKSEGAGNRICRGCKQTQAWREGDAVVPYKFGSLR